MSDQSSNDAADRRSLNETERNIQIHLGQFLNRAKKEHFRHLEHQENVDVVRLAIELARLRGTSEPSPYLSEAATLLANARRALEHEAERPNREMDELERKGMEELIQSGKVRMADIYHAGKFDGGTAGPAMVKRFKHGEVEFDWKVFTSKRGLQKLLETHAERKGREGAEKLAGLLAMEPLNLSAARDLVLTYLSVDDAGMTELENAAKPEEIRRFYESRQERSAERFACRLWEEIEAGCLQIATLYSLWQTRHDGNSARATIAASAKAGSA